MAVMVALAGCGGAPPSSVASSSPQAAAARADLTTGGTLRVGLPLSPSVLATKDPATGQLRGIAVDLGKELAVKLGVQFVPVVYPSPEALLADAGASRWDIGFGPAVKGGSVQVSDPFLAIPHTLLIRPGLSLATLADANRAGLKVAAKPDDVARLKAALPNVTPVVPPDFGTAIGLLKAGQVDGLLTGTFQLAAVSAQIPGSKILGEPVFIGNIAMVIPAGHSTGFSYVQAFLQTAKSDGFVQQAIDRTGASPLRVAA